MRPLLGLVAILAPCSTPHREEGREPPPPPPVAKPVAPAAKPAAKPVEVRAIGAGWSQSCALLADGDVRCWGLDAKPASVGITDATALSVAERHACVARSDGSVWCWGGNPDGQLGDGTTTDHAAPLRVEGVANIVEVAVGVFYSCARDRAGAVWCWGRGEFGGKKPTRIAAPVARGIIAGEETVCLTYEQAPPRCWGFNIDTFPDELGPVTTPTAKTLFTKATSFSIGARHACMVYEGVVYCAGEDAFGELGDQHVPANTSCSSDEHAVTCQWEEWPPPRPPPSPGVVMPDVPDRPRPGPKRIQKTFPVRSGYQTSAMSGTAVVIGEFRTCAIGRGTDTLCWDSSHRTPTLIANSHGTVALAVGSHQACALLADHSVRCWGENELAATPITF